MKPKLLVVELWGLGDLMIATPFLQAATEKFDVTLLARPFATELRPRFCPAMEIIPVVMPWTAFRNKYHLWRWPWRDLIALRRQLVSSRFDYGISARWDPRDHLLLRLSGARERIGFQRLNSRHYLTRSLRRPAPSAHRYEAWRELGRALELSLPPAENLRFNPEKRPDRVLVHTGARMPLRVWPLASFREIVHRLRQSGHWVQVACDPDQLKWWQSQGETPACPQTITELQALLDAAGAFIGNDSGPGHLAAACGCPTFTVFGPQLSEWFRPLHPAAEIMEGRECPYKPCSDYCRFAEPFCLDGISVEEVWPRVADFVSKNLKAISTTDEHG